ncbi:hypothetical protein FRC12_024680 [Ceratobasidium sp. 428]|nr:hypothetical protein FRC12_024680 [Ceratobasidium sp. 428]
MSQRKIEFDRNTQDLTGPIIDWCKTLHYPRIKRILLHRNPRPVPSSAEFFVAVILADSSIYSLQRLTPNYERLDMISWTAANDVVERVSPNDLQSSECLFTATFYPDHTIDFIFALWICHSIQSVSLAATRAVFAHSRSFAYALFANLVRSCLPKRDMVDGAETSRLENLWKDVYHSVQSQEYGFWEEDIADRTEANMRRLLRMAINEKLQHYSQGATPNSGEETGRTHQVPTAIPAVAWIEASASRRDSFKINLWDQAWNHRWEQLWKDQRWIGAFSWRMRLAYNLGLSWTIRKRIPDGTTSGRAAGRFPIMISGDATPNADIQAARAGEMIQLVVVCLLDIDKPHTDNSSQNAPEVKRTRLAHTVLLSRPTDCHLTLPDNTGPISFSTTGQAYIPTLELAAEAGWAAAWEHYADVVQGLTRLATAPLPENQTQEPGPYTFVTQMLRRSRLAAFTLRPYNEPDNEIDDRPNDRPVSNSRFATVARRAVNIRPFQDERTKSAATLQRRRDQDRARRVAMEAAERYMAREKRGCLPHSRDQDLANQAALALRRIEEIGNSPERNLGDYAKKELARLRIKPVSNEPMLNNQQAASTPTNDESAEMAKFKEKWELAWKECWKEAWIATWECGWMEGADKVVELSVAEVFDKTVIDGDEFLLEQYSYQQVKKEVQEYPTLHGSLGEIHSKCQELESLAAALRHSSPTPHEGIMDITMSTPRSSTVRHSQSTSLVANF